MGGKRCLLQAPFTGQAPFRSAVCKRRLLEEPFISAVYGHGSVVYGKRQMEGSIFDASSSAAEGEAPFITRAAYTRLFWKRPLQAPFIRISDL